MKTYLFLLMLCLPLISNQLFAQFYLKVDLNREGEYGVYLKSDQSFSEELVVGYGQITLTANLGDFRLSKIIAHNGEWHEEAIKAVYPYEEDFQKDYFVVTLKDGDAIVAKGLKAQEEILLFTFRNEASCTSSIELIDATDPILNIPVDYLLPISATNNSLANKLPSFYPADNEIYDISGVYDVGSTKCCCRFNSNPMEEIYPIEKDKDRTKLKSENN